MPSLLASREFRALLVSNAVSSLAARGLDVVVGFQVYQLTHRPLDLGLLGLVEAAPALTLVLYGGHVADLNDRRCIGLVTRAALTLLAVIFVGASATGAATIPVLFALVFLTGCVRAFSDPAISGLAGQVIARETAVRASSMLGGASQASAILGPAAAGLAYDFLGPTGAYAAVAVGFGVSALSLLWIDRKPIPATPSGESVGTRIRAGIAFVFADQVLVASMVLDLLAVLFGGAIALLPVFATDILNVGATGFGLLNAAPAVGSFAMMLVVFRYPPQRRAGRAFLGSVAGFGLATIVFALSDSFVLSLIALAVSGACDAVSVVVRVAILRLSAPENMRGRISAVSSIFIGASNEIGAFESGIAATVFGTRRAVWLGGLVTLAVVAAVAWRAPLLARLDLAAEARRDVPSA